MEIRLHDASAGGTTVDGDNTMVSETRNCGGSADFAVAGAISVQ